MTELAESVAETLDEIADKARAALQFRLTREEYLRLWQEVLALATHAGVEADDLRLLADL